MEENYSKISPVEKEVEVPEGIANQVEETPLDIIKRAAARAGIKLQDPKPNCKHCYGRGYLGVNQVTGEPIACNCILPPMNDITRRAYETRAFVPHNRKERRMYEKLIRRAMAKNRKK